MLGMVSKSICWLSLTTLMDSVTLSNSGDRWVCDLVSDGTLPYDRWCGLEILMTGQRSIEWQSWILSIQFSSKGSRTSKSGGAVGNKSLYERWKDILDDDPYDDEYNAYDLTEEQMAFCDAWDIKLRDRRK
ncbi:hypothetical protein Tco_1111076 [Tanacetum coccineum]|uniref:Uncharacterized protein n=1 Tax=Tanacetum coccineum TaxID=301880 RepID=A0ABQ5IMP6_9ASTR